MKTFTSFAGAMRDFFGLKPDQDLKGFMAELKELDDADREYVGFSWPCHHLPRTKKQSPARQPGG